MKYEVPIVYRGQLNYIIEAESPAQAAEIARNKFANDDKEDILGNEWESIEKIGEIDLILGKEALN